ncbi:hypothetical protein KC330_g9035 [Hortaea werneckii]|nr:hypothetical protein KC330_g9035 [Hortaea werneckii]
MHHILAEQCTSPSGESDLDSGDKQMTLHLSPRLPTAWHRRDLSKHTCPLGTVPQACAPTWIPTPKTKNYCWTRFDYQRHPDSNSYVAPREYPRQRRLLRHWAITKSLIYLTVTVSAWALITSLWSLSVSANHTLLPMVRRESENPPLTVTQSTQALQDFLASFMASPGLLAWGSGDRYRSAIADVERAEDARLDSLERLYMWFSRDDIAVRGYKAWHELAIWHATAELYQKVQAVALAYQTLYTETEKMRNRLDLN